MFQRKELILLKKRVAEPRRFIQVVLGPRQVGKTTLIKQLLKKLPFPNHYATADAIGENNIEWINQQWQLTRNKLLVSDQLEAVLVIDEIQKISNWSEIVKRLWDEDTFSGNQIKIILLGSSKLILQKGLSESLAGRFEVIFLSHWNFLEMKTAFGLSVDEFIWFGGYPGAVSLINDENRWKEYIKNALIETTISKDILMLTRIDKPTLLKNLFDIGITYSGQIVSFTKILGQLADAGNTTTLSNYLNLLDLAGLLSGLEKYSPTMIRQKSSSPKFMVQNTAFISATSNKTFKEAKSDPVYWGRIFESVCGAFLINECRKYNYQLFYWRDRNDEVDFIIQHGEKIIAIEIKSGFKITYKGMSVFIKRFHPSKSLLVGITGVDIEDFLSMDIRLLFN